MNPVRPVLVVLTSAFLLSACSGIEGDWQSREKLSNAQRNRLSFNAEGDGSMKVYFRLDGESLDKVKYSMAWEVDGNGDYDVVAECSENCAGDVAKEFEMECTLGDNSQLDCVAGEPFEGYGYFEFEPLETAE